MWLHRVSTAVLAAAAFGPFSAEPEFGGALSPLNERRKGAFLFCRV
jgi:hypothetical protein